MNLVEASFLRAKIECDIRAVLPSLDNGAVTQAESCPHVSIGLAHSRIFPGNQVVAVRLGHEEIPADIGKILGQYPPEYFDVQTGVRYRPQMNLFPGLSCSHVLGAPGTLGAIVRSKGTTGPHYILSCAHVLALYGKAIRGSGAICQPALSDAPPGASVKIGTLRDFKFSDGQVDAAIASIEVSGAQLYPAFIADDVVIQDPRAVPELERSLIREVRICGRSGRKMLPSGAIKRMSRLGTVTAHDIPVEMSYRSGIKRRWNRMIEIEGTSQPFSEDGDSGSLIVEANPPHRPFALLVGLEESRKRSIGHFFSDIESAMGIELSR